MDFYNKTGKMAIGSRLRRLSELLTQQAAQVYALYHIDMQPKWFPVFYSLAAGEDKTITEIAREIGHSHPSVSTIAREMVKKGYVIEKKGTKDGRKNILILSPKGKAVNEKIQVQYKDVNAAIEKAMQGTQYNLWKAIEEWEFLLQEKDLLQRVVNEKKIREAAHVRIVDYKPKYHPVFRQLNVDWITTYFKLEEPDRRSLDHPKEYILDKGGHILMALYDGKPVGTCALIKMNDDTFELAKMAVATEAKGKGIGTLLAEACISKARQEGASKIYLESNTRLKPAISLYQKMGFIKVTGAPSPYERANIQMELIL